MEYKDIITVDAKGLWRDRPLISKPRLIEIGILKSEPRIGQFAASFNLVEAPVVGGIRLHALQQKAGNLPLWREQIPELSIKVKKDGRYQRFYLVSRGTIVKTIRGLSISITVREEFTLPAGKPFYQFPLFQGESAEELGFSARLDSPAFPLKTDTVCKLNLSFAYGTDQPYRLLFEALDKSFPPVQATWRRTGEDIVTDAPAPQYPPPLTWTELQRVPKPSSNETSDLLEWMLSATDRLDSDLFTRPQNRTFGEISSYWHLDKHGGHFTFAKCNDSNQSVFIHENSLVADLMYNAFKPGQKVSFEVRERYGKYSAERVAGQDYKEETHVRVLDEQAIKDLIKNVRKRLYVPFIHVWRDGRSITDRLCFEAFAQAARARIGYLTSLLSQPELPQCFKTEILFLLACVHKDTTEHCVQWITEQVETGDIRNPRAVGFALGDVSEGWQQYILSSLASKPNSSAISVFSYAVWRERHFVERFSASELTAILACLSQRLRKINSVRPNGEEMKDKGNLRSWVRATTETLELLLGLLRTRGSTKDDVKMLLQPHQKVTKELATHLEGVAEIVAQLDINLFSRVQLNILKPADDRTPDLIYALRLYLTGDDGANAIRITSVSDDNND